MHCPLAAAGCCSKSDCTERGSAWSDVFAVVMAEASRAVGVFEAIAYVDVNAGGDMMKFAENVSLGRAD